MQILLVNPKPLPESLAKAPFLPIDADTPHIHWRDETNLFALIKSIGVPETIYLVSKLSPYIEVHIRPAED